ncbi:hypothetical protein RJT34_10094 [Clitoria ternatea]|uniref:Uncharacterized protein n=1 Tax=Clitoria ternatea TaxID=43366 RepID=A0AAN9K6H1_CLITE
MVFGPSTGISGNIHHNHNIERIPFFFGFPPQISKIPSHPNPNFLPVIVSPSLYIHRQSVFKFLLLLFILHRLD